MADNQFYKIPMSFGSIFDNTDNYMDTCSEKESIDHFIELLIMTCPGEHKYDKDFGSEIWEMDFVKVISPLKWQEQFAKYLSDAIIKYEHRITDIDVSADIVEITRPDIINKTTAIKKRAIIKVICKLISTGEQMVFYYTLFLGPISSN